MSAREIIAKKLKDMGVHHVDIGAGLLLSGLTAAGYRILGPDDPDPVTIEQCAAHLTDIAKAMWERTETHRCDDPFSKSTDAEKEDAITAYCFDKAAEAIRALSKEDSET